MVEALEVLVLASGRPAIGCFVTSTSVQISERPLLSGDDGGSAIHHLRRPQNSGRVVRASTRPSVVPGHVNLYPAGQSVWSMWPVCPFGLDFMFRVPRMIYDRGTMPFFDLVS
jgi:hypothetical protein